MPPDEAAAMVAAPGFRDHRWRWRDVFVGLAAVLLARVAGAVYAGAIHEAFPAWSWIAGALLMQAWFAGWPLLAARLRPAVPGARSALVEAGFALLALPVLLATLFGVGLLLWVAFGLQVEANPFEPVAGARDGYHPTALVVLGILAAPVAEEIFFRGMLFNALRQRMPFLLAALISAAAFGLMHPFGLAQRLGVVVNGLFLALIYHWRKTLVAPILIHAMVNALSFAILFYSLAAAAKAPVLGVLGEVHAKGCLVTDVTPGSAAEAAGLRAGDVITHAGEYSIRDRADLTTVVRSKKIGDKLPVWYERGGEAGYVEAVLQRRPEPPGAAGPTPPR